MLARHAGFCHGVKLAVKLAQEAARCGPVVALGEVVHNEAVLQRLQALGISFVESLEQVPNSAAVLIRTHGAAPEVFAEAARRDLHVIDATCIYVRRLQQLVAKLADEGKQVLVIGDTGHPEIRALSAWGRGQTVVISQVTELENIRLKTPLAVVFQTTQRRSIAEEIGEKIKAAAPAVEIYDTICQATWQRQEAARRLAAEVDVMVVIGSRKSANTRKLAEICRAAGAVTIEVAEAAELDSGQLRGAKMVGVTAGASTPDWTMKEVMVKMETEKDMSQQDEQVVAEQSAFAEMLRDFSVGEVVKGTVVQVDAEEVLVDIGYKSEGVLPRQEVPVDAGQSLSDIFQAGQELELQVKEVDSQEGKITLSRLGMARKLKWAEVEKAVQDGTILSGKVKEAMPAGLVVELGGGLEGFMPGSMVDVRYIPDFKEFVNTEISFKVAELRREREKVILSRKQLLEEEMSSKKEQVLSSLQTGQIIRGTVRRLTTFGAFVDVGGIDGLVHVSEISWNRVEHPSSALKVGEEVDVKVIELIPERERIGLSIRQAQPDPWTEVARKFKPGDVVAGRITRLVNFGAFVELIPGVEGLVHISQLASHHVKQPSEVVSEGQDVKVKILDINTAAKRVSLSMREAAPRPKKEPVQQLASDAAPALTFGDLFGDLFNGRKGE